MRSCPRAPSLPLIEYVIVILLHIHVIMQVRQKDNLYSINFYILYMAGSPNLYHAVKTADPLSRAVKEPRSSEGMTMVERRG